MMSTSHKLRGASGKLVRHGSYAAAILGGLSAAVVCAQQIQPSKAVRDAAEKGKILNPTEARADLEEFAACHVKKEPTKVLKLLTTRIDKADYQALIFSLAQVNDVCLDSGRMRFSQNLYRGALFQALYNREYKSNASLDFTTSQSRYRDIYSEPLSPISRNYLARAAFGECVTKDKPNTVRDLMRSEAGSEKEEMAFLKLSPSFNACMAPGVQITFTKALIKGILAESIYQLSVSSDLFSSER